MGLTVSCQTALNLAVNANKLQFLAVTPFQRSFKYHCLGCSSLWSFSVNLPLI